MNGEKYIFVHIPKTAGLSIRKLCESAFGASNVSPPFAVSLIDSAEGERLEQYQLISGHLSAIDVRFFADRKLFTFLRDPIDRCLSIYSYYRNHTNIPLIALDKITNQNLPREAISLARQLDPDDFFTNRHPHVVQNICNRMVWQLGMHAHFSFRNRGSDAEVLESALRNLERYVFVGFYENLSADSAALQRCWGISRPNALPSVNRTSNRLQSSDLSNQAVRHLRAINEADLRLYDAMRCA